MLQITNLSNFANSKLFVIFRGAYFDFGAIASAVRFFSLQEKRDSACVFLSDGPFGRCCCMDCQWPQCFSDARRIFRRVDRSPGFLLADSLSDILCCVRF